MNDMREFKVGDRVLIEFNSNHSKIWNGVVVGFSETDYLVEVEEDIHTLDIEWMKLDKQYYREERLDKLLGDGEQGSKV